MKIRTEDQFLQTMNELLLQLEEIPLAQFNQIPQEGSWSAGQVGEHLYKSYGVIKTLKGKVAPANRPIDQKIPAIKVLFLDYGIKMESPVAILPSEKNINKEGLLNGLRSRISEFKELINNEDLSLICTDYSIPEYGPFTRIEWIYFTIYHTMRHIHQLIEIKKKISERIIHE